MFNFSGSEIVFLLLLALIVLGPEKLPDAVRRFGKTYGEFKKMSAGFQSELKSALDEPMREMRDTADAFKRAASFDFDSDEPSKQPAVPTPAGAAPPLQTAAAPADPPADVPVDTPAVEPVAEPVDVPADAPVGLDAVVIRDAPVQGAAPVAAPVAEPPAEPGPDPVPPRPSRSSITRAPATFRRAPRPQTLRPAPSDAEAGDPPA